MKIKKKEKVAIKQFDNVKFKTYNIEIDFNPPKLGEVEKALDKQNQVTLDRIKKVINQTARPGVIVAYIHKLIDQNNITANELFDNDSKDTLEYTWEENKKDVKRTKK